MSYRDPGTVLSAPQRLPRRRSWGMYVGITIGFVVLLLIAGVGIYIARMASVVYAPLDKTAIVKSMEGIPVYEDAKYNEPQTKIQNGVVLPSLPDTTLSSHAAVIVYSTGSNPDFVIAWYDKEMQDRGYSIEGDTDEQSAPAEVYLHRYRKGDELTLVQTQRAPNKDETAIVVTRFTGYHEKG